LGLTLFAYPRFGYFHLIPLISFLSIFFGQNLVNLSKTKSILKLIAIFGFIGISVFFVNYLKTAFTKEIRFFEKDIFTSAAYIKNITTSGEMLYIQNGPDQIYSITGRLPIKPWADEFPWYLEDSRLQQKVVDSLKVLKPKFILFKPYDTGKKYETGVYRPELINDYIDSNYILKERISDQLWLKVQK